MAAKFVDHIEEKIKDNSAPWLTCAAAMPTAIVTHLAWSGDPVMQEVIAGSAVVMTGWTWHTWSRRHEHTRALATLIAGAVTGWTALATAASPWNGSMFEAWAAGTVVLSVMWNTRHIAHKPAAESDKSRVRSDETLETVGGALKGARLRGIKAKPGRVEADIELVPGTTADDVQPLRGAVASVVQRATEEVTIVPDKARADRLTMVFQENDALEHTVKWTGPSAPGTSIADAPLRIGMRADGKPLEMWIVGDNDEENPRALPHTLATGMTGSGKTATIRTAIIEMRSRIDVVPVVGDPAKFQQGFGNIADCLGIAAVNQEQTAQLIRNLPDTIAYRADLLGRLEKADGTTGYEQWEPECWTRHGIPLVFVDIEEATDMVDEDMDDPVRKARSVGIALCVSLQTAHFQNLKRKTRGQFANALVHGMGDRLDAGFSMSPETLEAGANPVKWGATNPGALYGELIGTPPEEWSIDAKAKRMTRAQERTEIGASRPTWAVLDPGTAMRLGHGIPMADAQITAGLPPVPDDPQETAYPAGMRLLKSIAGTPDQEKETDLTAVPTEEGNMDITAALHRPEGKPIPLRTTPRVRMTTEDARALVNNRIDILEDSNVLEVGFPELADLAEQTGRRPKWIYDELSRLVSEGRLREGTKPPYTIRRKVTSINGYARQ